MFRIVSSITNLQESIDLLCTHVPLYILSPMKTSWDLLQCVTLAASMLVVYFRLDDTYEKRWKLWVDKFLIVGNSTWLTLCHTVQYKIYPQLNTIDHCMIMFFITLTAYVLLLKFNKHSKIKNQGVQNLRLFGGCYVIDIWQWGFWSLTKGRSQGQKL